MTIGILRLAILTCGVAGSSAPAEAETLKVALPPFGSDTVDARKADVLSRLFVAALSSDGTVSVMTPEDINALIGVDRLKDVLGCNEMACLAELGGALDTEYLITGRADSLGDNLVMTAALMKTSSSETVARAEATVLNTEQLYPDGVRVLARSILNSLNGPPNTPEQEKPIPDHDPTAPTGNQLEGDEAVEGPVCDPAPSFGVPTKDCSSYVPV